MKAKDVSARNMGCMISLMVTCGQLMTGFNPVKQDIWLGVLSALLMALPLVAILIRIVKLNPQKDLFEIIQNNFGRVTSWALTLLMSWYALHVSALVTRNFSEFVSTISLENTPDLFIIIGMVLVAGYLATSDFNVIGRWSLTVLFVVSVVMLITVVFSISVMDINNLKPIMQEHSLKEIISVGFSIGTIAFGETVLALAAFGTMRKGDKPFKAYGIGVGIGALILLSATTRNILVLGREMMEYTIFPSYVAVRVISLGDFIKHFESIISFILILMGITKVAICLRVASIGTKALVKTQAPAKHIVMPIAMLAIAVGVTTFSNMQDLLNFAEAYRYYSLPFVLLIPIMIWLKSEMHSRSRGKRVKDGSQ